MSDKLLDFVGGGGQILLALCSYLCFFDCL